MCQKVPKKYTLLITREDAENLQSAADDLHCLYTDKLWTITKSNLTTEDVLGDAENIARILRNCGFAFDMMDLADRAMAIVREFENESNKE